MSILLVACDNNKKDTMIIQQSEFSEETQEVLKIVEDEIAFFDYKVDETIKSIFIDIWTYKGGKWINSGGTHGNINSSEKRIALWIKLGNDKSSMAPRISENFREADCDADVAVTITFSDKSID